MFTKKRGREKPRGNNCCLCERKKEKGQGNGMGSAFLLERREAEGNEECLLLERREGRKAVVPACFEEEKEGGH